jgi:hypothetical protein
VFAPMKDGLGYCVLIKWKTGTQSRVNHFACVRDAQRWIDHESENWFRSRIEARARQRSVAGENLREPGFQPLQTASAGGAKTRGVGEPGDSYQRALGLTDMGPLAHSD